MSNEVNAEMLLLLRNIDDTIARIADSIASLLIVEERRNYTTHEAEKVLGCSVRTIERRIHEGALIAVKTGAYIRIPGKAIRVLQAARPDTIATVSSNYRNA